MFKLYVTGMTALIVSLAAQGQNSVRRPPQFVNLAFDGSKSARMWRDTLDFAHNNSVKFTYFMSSVYFISNNSRNIYNAPRHGLGRSAIGFGGTAADIQNRNAWVEAAMARGHEMAGHANGHFDGSSWSLDNWLYELEHFSLFMVRAEQQYGGVRQPRAWRQLFESRMLGFRAPQLGHNQQMFRALQHTGYRYDTSKVQRMDYWPQKDANGVWNFPLAGVRMAYSGRNTLSMDYNMYVAQSGATQGDPANFQYWEDEVVETYLNYFRHNYYGNRAPVDIGHHFSLWNGGIYWRALQRVAQAVCHLPEVVCGTYQDMMAFLDSKPSQEIQAYQAGRFAKFQRQALLPEPIRPASLREFSDPELSAQELEELSHQACPSEAHQEDLSLDFEI
jgi:peptidoglycan/xylan/chitin deacetylase (PgdA/CDA1 family)